MAEAGERESAPVQPSPAKTARYPAARSALVFSPDDLDVMARTVWGEARGEPLEGKLAVAWVIRNRAGAPGWWGEGIAGVCRQPWQFSCWNAGDPNRAKLIGVSPRDEMFRDCLMVVAGALSGNLPDPTVGANHYHARGVSPAWATGRAPALSLRNHVFYKL
jgi:spore germination cell wall hydrolase CwlJ-like protein